MPLNPARPARCAALLLVLASGCASTPATMTLFPGDTAAAQRLTWPALPEVPRYRYSGQLVGEVNFQPGGANRRTAAQRFVRWVVGMDAVAPQDRTLLRPQSGMVDDAGRIYVTDVGRKAVFVFDAAAGTLSIWERADGGAAFAAPVGIAPGPPGEIHVSDAELGRVVRLNQNGEPLGSFGMSVLLRPTGIVRDAESGLTYVADTAAHDIKLFDDGGRLVRSIGGPGTAPGQFNSPTFLALDGDRLVVSDTLNARVQILSTEGEPEAVIGQRGLYVGNLTRPKGVTVDEDGNVYVVESYYDYLLVFDRQGRYLLPIGGTGNAPGKFYLPGGMWSDRTGRIYVADVFNGRIVMFEYLGE